VSNVASDCKTEYNVQKSFIQNFKREKTMKEDIKKAVDSMSADVENKPVDDATLNAENAPSIQEASTPSKQEEAASVEEPVKQEEPAPQAEPEVKAEEPAPEAPQKELDFNGLFSEDYQVGSTLQQDPKVGGNVMTNMKKPGIDYVERAKNHKNVSFSAEEMSKKDK